MTPAALTDRPSVTIVIVTWNACETLEKCLQSIVDHAAISELEIRVVDNASSDGTIAIAERFPCRVHRLDYNRGFAGAANIGIREASGNYILLLNPDATLMNDVTRVFMEALDSVTQPAVVGPIILDQDGSIDPTCARRFPSVPSTLFRLLGGGVAMRRLLPRPLWTEAEHWARRSSPVPVPCLTGAALFARKALFEKHGYLDETVPMYYEDLEMCARVTRLGGMCLLAPAARVTHIARSSTEASPIRSLLYSLEDGHAPWLYFEQYRSRSEARSYVAAIAFGSAFRILLLGPLVWIARRRAMRGPVGAMQRSQSLLRWAAMDKQLYQADINQLFAPGVSVRGDGAR